MIKLKQLIKDETIHSCDCGGDCCSVNESKGMELGKIFTGHGFAFKKEDFEESLKGGSLPNKEKDFRKIKKVKDEPDSQKGSSDSTDTFTKHHAGSMGAGDMGQIAEPDTYDWDDSGSEPNKPGHQTMKNKKKKGYEPVEVKESDLGLTYKKGKTIKVTHKKSGKELVIIDKPNVKREYERIGYFAESVNEGFDKYHLGNVTDSKLKKRLERAIKLWGGKVDAVGMDTIKFRLSSSEVTKLPLLLKKLDQNKNVWIGDKRKKNIWDRKRKIDKLESCGYTMSAEPPHKKLKSSGGTGPEDRELKVNEGKWSKIMRSVRKGSKSGPWSIVVFKNRKVLHQRLVKVLQQIPAHYEDVKKKYPRDKIGIEDKYGERVYTESIDEWKKFRGKMTYGDAKPQKGDYVKTIAGIAQIEKIRGSIAYMKLPGKKTKGYWMNDIKNLKPTEKKEKGKTLWTESINERTVRLSSIQKKAILIAVQMFGNMTGAVKKIEKLKKGLSKDKKVVAALRLANESINEAKVLKFTDIKDRTLEKHLKVVTKKVGAELSKISGGFQVSGDMRALTAVVDYVFDKSIKKGVMKGGGMSKIQLANESIKENLIYVDKDMKDGKFDPKNPQVHIQGYGVVNLKTLQDSLSRKFVDLSKRAKKGDFENIQHHLEKNSVVVGFVGAGVDANKQLKTSQMKRKITMYKQKRYK